MSSHQFHPRRAGLVSLAAAAVLAGSTACASLGPAASPTPVQVAGRSATSLRMGKAVRGDVSGVVSLVGDVRAKGEVPIVPRVTARLNKVLVEPGARVAAGDVLAELDPSDLNAQVLQAEAAQAAAEARLAQLKAAPRPEAVAQAQANLKAAQARVKSVEMSQTSANVETLQKRLDDARARLKKLEAENPSQAAIAAAQNRLNAILNDPARKNDQKAIDAARADLRAAEEAARSGVVLTVDQARRDVQDAEQALAQAEASVNTYDLEQAKALVEAAQAQVKLVGAPASADEIAVAQAAVAQAKALADLARARVEDAAIKAPIDGIVAEVHALAGSTVGPTGPLVTIIPPELQVVVQVDESQLAYLQLGQTARLSIEGYPRESFAGTVKSIAPVLDPRTRSAAVKVEVGDPGRELRPGLFTQVAVDTGQRPGVVLVPREAVLQDASTTGEPRREHVVYVVEGSRVQRQTVVVGAADAKNVEILEGLTEGTDVVLNPRPELKDGDSIATSS